MVAYPLVTLYEGRFLHLEEHVPQLFTTPGTLLYVGANHKRSHYMAELFAMGHEMTLLEIFEGNALYYRQSPVLQEVICGDVRDKGVLAGRHWDIAFWWHGPEHVPPSELERALKNLEAHANLVVLGCPFGLFEQPPVFGNLNEEHSGTYYPVDFKRLGYETSTQGPPDNRLSNLLAWKVSDGH